MPTKLPRLACLQRRSQLISHGWMCDLLVLCRRVKRGARTLVLLFFFFFCFGWLLSGCCVAWPRVVVELSQEYVMVFQAREAKKGKRQGNGNHSPRILLQRQLDYTFLILLHTKSFFFFQESRQAC